MTDALFTRTAAQRSLRMQDVGEYSSASTELQHCRDELLLALRKDHAVTMARLAAAEKRLDAMLAAASGAM